MDNLVKNLRDNTHFRKFELYILEKVGELDSIDGLANLTNEQAGEEAKVRLKTAKKLQEILSPFIKFQEKKEPTQEEIKKAEKSYGL